MVGEMTVTTTANKMALQGIETIKIDPRGRYVLLVKDLHTEAIQERLCTIRAWGETGEILFVLYGLPDIGFHIERVYGE